MQLDKTRWGRKVFKIYKFLRLTESKAATFQEQSGFKLTLISKRLLRLVVVLFNLKQGMSPAEIRE